MIFKNRISISAFLSLSFLALSAYAVSGGIPVYQGPLKCQKKEVDDLWFDSRLGCVRPGQQFIFDARGAGEAREGVAYVVNERLSDTSLRTANNGMRRYYQGFLCVRNVPADVTPMSMSMDLYRAFGTAGTVATVPGIGFISTSISGGGRGGSSVMPCDPMKHPVIVDYRTGKIESVNPEALKAINVYELPES
ncbi:hypothetical protein [Chromobacterium violaceum]|uniref:hypothetical protein n=1 Tax=Chromobacterium violaceum TaxID=536 RepID=UPI0005BACF0F|nr:hypothetical protein [Chromobacterium violaceum]